MVKSHTVVPRVSNLKNRKHSLDDTHIPKWVSNFVSKLFTFLCIESALIALVLIGTGAIFVQ